MKISGLSLDIHKAPSLRLSALALQAVLAILAIGAGNGLGSAIENDAKTLEAARRVPPTLVKGAWRLPAVPSSHKIELYGSDNVNVVALDGSYYRPLVGMDVNVMYRITNKSNLKDSAVSQGDIVFSVKGKYPDRGQNPEPDVIPALREWHGGKGEFCLTQQSRLVAPSGENAARSAAQKTQHFFKEMLGLEPGIADNGGAGCVEFVYSPSLLGELGAEGYYLTIDEQISIKAASEKGLMYGGVTVTQILYGSKDKRTAPKGEARDYPRYPVRAGMIDVARQYIPLKYVEQIGRYMAWFKLNELQVHLNDYWGATAYKAFRLQSERYPSINLNLDGNTKNDGIYTKADYRAFQKELLKYGVEVTNEIDTPAHSEIFRNAGMPMLDVGDMDVIADSNRETVVKFILDLFDEYTSGPDPVFVGKKVHFGSDEYGDGSALHDHLQALYNKAMTEGLLAKGLKVRTWAEPATLDSAMPDELAKNPNVEVNMWAPYHADTQSIYNKGYNVINTAGGWLYLVPGCATGYPDYWGRVYANNGDYRLDYLYDSFDANNFSPKRNNGKGGAIMPKAHPQTRGTQFCVWHDFPTFNGGLSEFDLFDRMRDVIPFVAEKSWHGEKTNGQTYTSYAARFSKLANRAPGGNPRRFVESASNLVASYRFGSESGLKDFSGNGYTALAQGAAITPDGLELSGNGKISLPFGSMGYPYTVRLKAKLADVPADTILFKGRDGTLYANYQGRGGIGFERGEKGIEYHFEFVDADGMTVSNPAIAPNAWFDLVLTCDKRFSDEGKPAQTDTALYINGAMQAGRATCVWIHDGKSFIPITGGSGNRKGVTYDSNSFVLPVEEILQGAKAIVKSIDIYNKKMGSAEILSLYKIGDQAAGEKLK